MMSSLVYLVVRFMFSLKKPCAYRLFVKYSIIMVTASHKYYCNSSTIKQGDSDSEVIICFVLNLISQQILQLLIAVTVSGITLRHCYK